MKIVYLTQYAVDGQLQSQFFNYAKYIDKVSYQVSVYYLFPYKEGNSLIQEFSANNIEVNSLNFSGFRISISNLIKFVRTFAKMDVDIIHSQHPIAGFYNKIGTTILKVFFRKRIKIIVEQRCVKQNLSFFARILETVTHPLANLVLCSSDSAERSYFAHNYYLTDFLSSQKSVRHITFYNSIDLSFVKRSHLAGDTSHSQRPFKICIVGRNEPVKQPLLILKAMSKLKEYDIHLYMAGHGSLDKEIATYIETNSLQEKVHLLGNIDWVPQLLWDSHLYINYSIHEGLSKSLLEAMAMGLPVIVSKVPGNIEVAGSEGEYALSGRHDSYADLVSLILEFFNSEYLYNDYSRRSVSRATDFDVREKIRDIERIYIQLLTK